MIYLTYGEPPSGVYFSQVTDVINYLNKAFNTSIRLVAFISLHDFKKNKTAIKNQIPNAIVLPMLPKAPYWEFSTLLLWFLTWLISSRTIIARNVIAANMALLIKGKGPVKRVCFDGRGAMEAEWNEYDVTVATRWKNAIGRLEQNAVIKSDFRIAVTQKLVEHWNSRYNYNGKSHVVIPCTLNSSFNGQLPSEQEIEKLRNKIGIRNNDVVLAYSGSTSGWQSFEMLYTFLSKFLKAESSHKVIFLAKEEPNITRLIQEFPEQVQRKWVNHYEVTELLLSCDIGILIREQSITNHVASPTKFAEYLSAGLPVIISENLGDYTDFVKNNHCGIVFKQDMGINFTTTSYDTRKNMIKLVSENWTKNANNKNYSKLIESIQ